MMLVGDDGGGGDDEGGEGVAERGGAWSFTRKVKIELEIVVKGRRSGSCSSDALSHGAKCANRGMRMCHVMRTK